MIDDGADGFWNGLNIVWSCSHADSCSHAHPVKNGYYKGVFILLIKLYLLSIVKSEQITKIYSLIQLYSLFLANAIVSN